MLQFTTKHLSRKLLAALSAITMLAVMNLALAETKPAASIPAAELIQPADLAAILKSDAKNSATAKPLILQVGFRTMYYQAHIPGAEYAGPGNKADGLQSLRDRVAKLAKDSAIVLYCGCCPWTRCPNVAAAYDTLHELGFTKVKVMYIADNFGNDWVEKGYPTIKGQ